MGLGVLVETAAKSPGDPPVPAKPRVDQAPSTSALEAARPTRTSRGAPSAIDRAPEPTSPSAPRPPSPKGLRRRRRSLRRRRLRRWPHDRRAIRQMANVPSSANATHGRRHTTSGWNPSLSTLSSSRYPVTTTLATATTNAPATSGHQLSRPTRPRVRAEATRTEPGAPRSGRARRVSSTKPTRSSGGACWWAGVEFGRSRRLRRIAARTGVERPSMERTLPATAANKRPVRASRSHDSPLTLPPRARTSESAAARPATANTANPTTSVVDRSRAVTARGIPVGRRATSTVAGCHERDSVPAANRRCSGNASSRRGSISRRRATRPEARRPRRRPARRDPGVPRFQYRRPCPR